MFFLYIYALFNIVSSISGFVIACFAFFSRNPTPQKRILALWLWSIGIWSFGVAIHALTQHSPEKALFWSRFLHVGAIFIPVLYLHLVMVLTGKAYIRSLKFLYALTAVFLFSLFSKLMIKDVSPIGPFSYFPKAGVLYHLYVLEFCTCIMVALFLLGRKVMTSRGYERNQVKFIFIGSLIAYSTGPSAFLYEYQIPIFPFGTPLVLANSLVIAYAILKHRIMDITIIIRKTLIYSSVMASLTLVYLGTITLFAHIFEGISGYQTVFSSAIAAGLITICFQPLRKKVQTFVDGKFFRQYVDREEKLYELSREVITHTTPEAMGQALIRVLGETMYPKAVALYLKARDGDGYMVAASVGNPKLPERMSESNPLTNYFADHPQPFVQDLPETTGEPLDTRRPSQRREDVA